MAEYNNDVRLNTFSAQVGDLARANRFIATFTGTGAGSVPENLRFFVKTSQLPGRTLGDLTPLQWFGKTDKRAGDQTYDDITLTFHNDVNFTVKRWVEEWMERIAGGKTNVRGVAADYMAQLKMEQIGSGTTVIATYQMYGVYPKALTPIDVSMDSQDTTQELSITFNVNDWMGEPNNDKAVGVFESN